MKEFNKDISINEKVNDQPLYKLSKIKYCSLEMISNCYQKLTRLIGKQKRKHKLPTSGMNEGGDINSFTRMDSTTQMN